MVGDTQSFRTPTTRNGKRNVVAIFDQSGSMRQQWKEHGAAFAAALMELNARGVMNVSVILTGGRRTCLLPTDGFDARWLSRMPCVQGCESVDDCLSAHRALVIAADTVIIYTDGYLTDGNVEAGHWSSLGVDLVGCAVTTLSYITTQLTKHFSRAITADDGARLATALVQYVASRR
jgi:hypothetical protein